MANPEDVGILLQGVARWNDWRKTKDGPSLDLSGADLRNRDLTGADLRAVNLSGAILRGTKIGPGSLLWNANLSGADLYGADLRGADLQEVNFSGIDLFLVDLREANLQGADLSTAKGGLLSKQLAGADLTGAKLPDPLEKLYDSLSSIKEISDSAQKLFLALLAGCLYSWLTIAQTTDVDLITNRASTPLPIIQAAIPIVGFYVVTPLILLCLYFYFHFYLQKLWEELGTLPAIFPDGRLVHNRTDPWLLNDLVRSYFAKLKDGRPFLSYFQAWVSVVLAWWLVPVTLFLFWGRYLRRHDLFWTVFHALLLALAVFSAARLYRIAGETLRGLERSAFRLKEALKSRHTYVRLTIATVIAVFFLAISAGAIPANTHASVNPPSIWISTIMECIRYSPFANLTNTDVSIKPPNWTGKNDGELDFVKGPHLEIGDLRGAIAENAFFAKANLEELHMEGSYLYRADFRKTKLANAYLDDANLTLALLQDADMDKAHLQNAKLMHARLDGANLQVADLEHANLDHASLIGAYMGLADLKSAFLAHATFQEAQLNQVTLRESVSFGANLTGANLIGADFTNANFKEAIFEHANMKGADLTGAKLDSARIKYADLREAKGLTASEILKCIDYKLAFFDPDILKRLPGIDPDHHNEKLEEQKKAEQKAKAAATAPPYAAALSHAPKAKP